MNTNIHHKSILSISALFHDFPVLIPHKHLFYNSIFYAFHAEYIYFSATQTIMEKMRHSHSHSDTNGSIRSSSRESSMRRVIESRNKWSQTHIVKKQLTNGCKTGSEYVAGCFFPACVCVFARLCERLVHSRFFVGSVIVFMTPPTHKIIPTRMTLYTFYGLKKDRFFSLSLPLSLAQHGNFFHYLIELFT